MVKRVWALLAVLILLVAPAATLADTSVLKHTTTETAETADTEETAEETGAPAPVVDDAGLLSDDEIAEIEEKIEEIREKYDMDAVVVTTYDVPKNAYSSSMEETRNWADDFYDDNGYGLGEDRAGILYLIDMRNRVSYVSTAGVMIDYISDDRLEELLDTADAYLYYRRYGDAAMSVLDKLEDILNRGIEEGHFRYDEATGERLTGLYNKLTASETAAAGVCGGLVTAVIILIVSGKYALRRETYKFNKLTQSRMTLTQDEKTFLRQDVTRVRMPQGGGGGGRSGGGGYHGGGGSGVHTSSGGFSHGGGGHHF